jgi:hypothetical protein
MPARHGRLGGFRHRRATVSPRRHLHNAQRAPQASADVRPPLKRPRATATLPYRLRYTRCRTPRCPDTYLLCLRQEHLRHDAGFPAQRGTEDACTYPDRSPGACVRERGRVTGRLFVDWTWLSPLFSGAGGATVPAGVGCREFPGRDGRGPSLPGLVRFVRVPTGPASGSTPLGDLVGRVRLAIWSR